MYKLYVYSKITNRMMGEYEYVALDEVNSHINSLDLEKYQVRVENI